MSKIRINYIQIFICFGIPWLLFFLSLFFGKEIYYFRSDTFWQRLTLYLQRPWFWRNFLPAAALFCIGSLINLFIINKKHVPWLKFIMATAILIAIDQTIQFLVAAHHDTIRVSLVEGWIGIFPKSMSQDDKGIYLSNGQLEPSIHLLVCFLGMSLGYYVVRILYFFERERMLLVMSAFFYIAGFVCSALDTLVYEYGYDYIEIYSLCIFDIKDIYILLGFSSLLQSVMQNADVLNKISIKKDIKRYLKWEYSIWQAWLVKLMRFFRAKKVI
ncbi:MAG: signal peptidase II [Treponema sp.]|jgi:lipoprotein signal peptidase|nr:signal peptidase II [Treponema sp.]